MTKAKLKTKTANKNLVKPVVNGSKLFVELFLKYEGEHLSAIEIARTKREGVKNISDGKFWLKICKEYAKKVYCS